MSSAGEKQATARSPMAGCVILIAALLVMLFLIVFSVTTLFRQFDEIVKFTGEKPNPVELDVLDGREDEVMALEARLKGFNDQLHGETEARLELGVDDLNLAIAVFDHFKELRKTFRVVSIEDDLMRIEVSFPLNGKPRRSKEGEGGFISSDNRYLNGVLLARPRLMKQEVVLKLDDIEVDGAKVPEEFVQQMSPYRMTERYLTDPILGPAMKQLTRVDMMGGKVVLVRVPGELPEGELSEEEVGMAGTRFMKVLGIAATAFLIFAGIMVIFGLKKKVGGE